LNANAAAAQARTRAGFRRGVEGVKTGAREFGAGFTAGSQGEPVDTSAFNPGEGTTDKTPRRPDQGGIPFAPLEPEFEAEFGQPKPAGADEIVVSDRQPGTDPFRPDTNIRPPSLATAGRDPVIVGDKGGSGRPPRGDFNVTGDLKDLPPGFIQTIRGGKVGFQDAGGSRFASVPGLSPEESRGVAARRDPAFNVQTQEGLEQQRINTANLEAATNRIEARTTSQTIGLDAGGALSLFERDDAGNLRQVVGVDPFVESLMTSQNKVEVVQAGDINPLTGFAAESTILVDLTEQRLIGNFTEQLRVQAALRQFQTLGGEDATGEEREEIIAQVEALLGPSPELRTTQRLGQ